VALALLLLALLSACETVSGARRGTAEPNALSGLVLDPEGKPVAFARVSVQPIGAAVSDGSGDVVVPDGSRGLAVTTEAGRWVVDRLSDGAGAEIPVPSAWHFEVTVYKPGFHLWKDAILFDRGAQAVDVTLYPDTIEVQDAGNLVDTTLGDTNTGTGVLRQGE
jgi:hypothetical protein